MFNNKRILGLGLKVDLLWDTINTLKSSVNDTDKIIAENKDVISKLSSSLRDSNEKIDKFNIKFEFLQSLIDSYNVKTLESIKTMQEDIFLIKSDIEHKNAEFDIKLSQQSSQFDKRLMEFHKEISDRYFNAIESMYRFTKEISIIDKLSSNGNGDFAKLKRELIAPILSDKWAKQDSNKGANADENIYTMGKRLVQMRKDIHDDMLIQERQGKDISNHKGKLEILNLIIGDEI